MRNIFLFIFLMAASGSFSQTIPSVKIDELTRMIDASKEPLVINFWASWCAPCIQEIPWFEKQVEQFKNKGVKLLLVSLDFAEDYPAKLESFVKKNKYASDILWLAETDADVFCPKIDKSWEGNIPATLLVNNSTGYRYFVGSQIKESQLKKELDKLVK